MMRIKSKVGLRVLAGGLLWLLALGALAAQTIGNLNYNFNATNKTAHVQSASMEAKSINIPATVTYDATIYTVTSIGASAFSRHTGLTSVTIPNSVTSIGDGAFRGCTGLTAITVNSANEYFCSVDGVLYNKDKTRLVSWPGGKTEVNIPSWVTSIGASAFSGCTGLTSVTIPNSVTEIGYEAFKDCTGLTSIEISASVDTVGARAFYHCTGLTHVTIADRETPLYFCKTYNSSTGTKTDVFESCPIQSLYLGGDVDYHNDAYYTAYYSPFETMTTLDTVTFGRSVTGLRDRLFKGCTGLRAVQLPRRVTEIGKSAFEGCTGLTSLAMPAVTSIGRSAFSGCTGLTEVAMPAVTGIGESAFSGCMGLTEVAMPEVREIHNEAFKGCAGLTEVAMPEVDYIRESAFSGCTGLTEVEMPAVTSIGGSAFKGCTGLTEVAMPAVAYIDASAFSGCTGLTEVTMPVVTEIGASAFSGCTGLTEVTMPVVTEIGASAFSGCTGLRSVAMRFWNYGRMGAGVFEGCTDLVSVQWETTDGAIRSVPARCFAGCTALEDIVPDGFWSGLQTIGDSAFMGCTALKLKEVVLRQVQSLGKRAFQNCHGLQFLSVSDTLREIGIGAFEGCAALDTLILGPSLDFIAYDAFKGCTGLRSVTCRGAVPAECEDGAFTGVDKAACRLLVPQASVDAYGAAAEWRDFDLVGGDVNIYVSALELLPREIYLDLSDSDTRRYKLRASVAPVRASNPVLAWSTSDRDVVSFGGFYGASTAVGEEVELYGNYAGTAVITARTTDGSNLSAECRVTVGYRATAIRIKKYGSWGSDEALSETELTYGDSLRLMADVGSATNRVVAWTSSAPDVLQVDSLGWVRTVGFGTATVTARTTDGSDLEATCEVTVTGVPVKTLRIEAAGGASAMLIGHSLRLSAVITPSNASIKRVIWSSSDEGVAKVDSTGTVSGLAIGEAIITARTTDGSGLEATCALTVKEPVPVKTLEISTGGASPELYPGGTLQLSAVVTPADATNKTVTWSSSDTKVARVNQSGYVEAVAIGEAVITARTTDGSGLEATCALTVKPVLAESIRISTNGKSTTLKVNATLQLSAIITPDNATSTAVTWSSSDAGVATVSTTGRVRAVAIGEAVVTARTTDGSDLSATCNIKVVAGTAVEVPDALQAVRVYAEAGRIEVRGLPLGTAVTLSGVDGRLWYQTEAVTGSELSLVAPCGHVYVLRLNHTHSFKVYLP